MSLDNVRGHKANTAGPVLGSIVEHVVNVNVGVLGGNLIQLLSEQNVLLVNISVNEVDLGLIRGVSGDGSDDLVHGSDTGTTSNHVKSLDHVGSVVESTLGASDLDGRANSETSNVLGNVTIRVRLDKQIKVALIKVGGGGGVRAHDFLAIDLGHDGNVLANGQAKGVAGSRETETVNGRVGRQHSFLDQRELIELDWVENRARGLGGDVKVRGCERHKSDNADSDKGDGVTHDGIDLYRSCDEEGEKKKKKKEKKRRLKVGREQAGFIFLTRTPGMWCCYNEVKNLKFFSYAKICPTG